MYYGTSGECIEVCGDGKDYGMNECEDGNTINGDGCSSTCKVEPGYKCYPGNYERSGFCVPTITDIFNLKVTEDNNILVEFTEDVMILGELTKLDIEVFIYSIKKGASRMLESSYRTISWTIPNETYALLPTRILYL